MTTWTPTHPSTAKAWEAVVNNLQNNRQHHDGWGSRNVATTIAQDHGLTPTRAYDLIRSAIKNGYLEQRTDPIGQHSLQVRLAGDVMEVPDE